MTTPEISIYETYLQRGNLRELMIEQYMSITLLRENRGKEAEIRTAAEKWADEQMKRGTQ